MKFIKELDEGNYTGNLLNKVTTANFIVSTTQYLQSQCETRLHAHKNPHICFLFQGTDIESRENELSYTRKAGEIFFYDADEPHRTITTLKSSKNLNAEIRDVSYLKTELSPSDLRETIETNIHKNFLSLRILEEMYTYDDITPLSLEILCLELFHNWGIERSRFVPGWVGLLRNYLNDNWQNKHSLSDLSKIAGIHPVNISKNFKKYFHCSYGQYMRGLRIRESLSLIKNSEMSLTQVAFECGFSDQSHFTRNFKIFTGLLPKQFERI